jgi:hypothetical protein
MSRCGRAQDLLRDWKAHPEGCTVEHTTWGYTDGDEDGHGLDAWDVVVLLDQIDPMFHGEAEDRLRKAFEHFAPEGYAEFVAWENTPPGARAPQPPGVNA